MAGGHIRAPLDPELLQVFGDGAVVYAEYLGDVTQRSSCRVFDGDEVDVGCVKSPLHWSGSRV